MNQSWTLCWIFTAKSYRKAPQHSPSPPSPCLSWRTSIITRTTRPQSLAGIFPPIREVSLLEAEDTTVAACVVLSIPTREACGSYWHQLMMMLLRTQPLHPIHHPQPRSPHHLCCPLIALIQLWSPPMVPRKKHTSLICRPHLPRRGISLYNSPLWYIPLTSDALLTRSQMI